MLLSVLPLLDGKSSSDPSSLNMSSSATLVVLGSRVSRGGASGKLWSAMFISSDGEDGAADISRPIIYR